MDTIEENEKKHKSEIELCKAADVVVAVGSRLQQKYSRSLPNVEVQRITPGILQKFFSDCFVKQRPVCIIMYGVIWKCCLVSSTRQLDVVVPIPEHMPLNLLALPEVFQTNRHFRFVRVY